jgi:predicted GNAT family acetyltransferase
MAIRVVFTQDPAEAFDLAESLLLSDPVRHNVMLTLLHARMARLEPGRYWVATEGGKTCGMVLQTPLDYFAGITPAGPEVTAALVEAIAGAGVALPGIIGDAASAANFAGQWAEHQGVAATPIQAQRLYELGELQDVAHGPGHVRVAGLNDREQLLGWVDGFLTEIGERHWAPAALLEPRLAQGSVFLWEDGAARSLAMVAEPVGGVARITLVYTPREERGHGYATACVGAVARRNGEAGHRSILFTDLANPLANRIYRRLGFRPAMEALKYRFG